MSDPIIEDMRRRAKEAKLDWLDLVLRPDVCAWRKDWLALYYEYYAWSNQTRPDVQVMRTEQEYEQLVRASRAIIDDPLGFLLGWLFDWAVRLKESFVLDAGAVLWHTAIVVDEMHDGSVEENIVYIGPEYPAEDAWVKVERG